MKNYTFKEFKKFLTNRCPDEKLYGDGKYDRKIYNWFDVGKPIKVEFYTKGGEKASFKNYKNISKPKKIKFYNSKTIL